MGVGEATGFLVAGSHVPAATVGREPTAIRQARADRMDEIMQTVAASMLGVTVGCARCHNHKFDPITITDYYALTAVFQGVEFGGRHPEFAEDHPRRLRAKDGAEARCWRPDGPARSRENCGALESLSRATLLSGAEDERDRCTAAGHMARRAVASVAACF